ncbi:Gfo/Idh/MocA family protein [Reichenbachiella versicolor]|uniref:Gfo/Idh/MocA family protein n=1 Tax=Reichenbachiella versicolor TaxID=1821036 RepID=UPI000D6DE487|nr:Gfo/Idh/MocA family oxidoreductase [Reichenbachiella versicolor]
MNKLKIVSIGAGYFSKFHIEAWKRIPEVELVAICDLDLPKAVEMANEFEVKHTFETLEDAFNNIDFDIVDIITPPSSHLKLCQQAASHGKHILCQKPLAPSYSEAKKLVESMNQSGVQFMVHENFRFQPWHQKIKQLLNSGIIGSKIFSLYHRMRMGDGWPDDAYLARQPYFREMPRLLIYETGIHFIDVFRYLLGDIQSVYAKLRKLNQHIAGEDSGIVMFEIEGGIQAILDANRYNEVECPNPRYTFGETRVDAEGGSLRLDIFGNIFIKKLGKPEEQIEYQHNQINFAGDCVYYTQKHFIDCMIKNIPFDITGNHYLQNLKVQEAVYQSHQQKREVKIDN